MTTMSINLRILGLRMLLFLLNVRTQLRNYRVHTITAFDDQGIVVTTCELNWLKYVPWYWRLRLCYLLMVYQTCKLVHLEYMYNNMLYKLVWKPKTPWPHLNNSLHAITTRPCTILMAWLQDVQTHQTKPVTDDVRAFLGPCKNFYDTEPDVKTLFPYATQHVLRIAYDGTGLNFRTYRPDDRIHLVPT